MLGSLDTNTTSVYWVSTEWQPQARAPNIHYFIFSQHSWDGGGIVISLVGEETEAEGGDDIHSHSYLGPESALELGAPGLSDPLRRLHLCSKDGDLCPKGAWSEGRPFLCIDHRVLPAAPIQVCSFTHGLNMGH